MKALSTRLFKLRKITNRYLPKTGALGKLVEFTIKNFNTHIDNNLRIASFGVVRSYENASLTIGENFQSNNGLMLICRNRIRIGRNVTIGPYVCIVDFNHNYYHENLRDNYILGTVDIGNNVWIGSGVIVLPNSVIGDNCVIGAGTIVSGKVPANTVYYNPRERYERLL